MHPLQLPIAAAVLLLASESVAVAHVRLLSLPSRYGDQQKQGPCGITSGERTANVTSFDPGATLTLRWNEFIEHPGHFRISFDADGDDDFVDPATADELNAAPSVLIDGIGDRASGGDYEQDLTLPDLECERCTLQLIQVMTDKPPYGDGNDIYYQCADLVLRSSAGGGGADAGADDNGDPDVTDPGDRTAGCAAGGGTAAPPVLLLCLLVLTRRFRHHFHPPDGAAPER